MEGAQRRYVKRFGAWCNSRIYAGVHINSARAEESPRSHVNHRDKMAPPYLLGAMCTQCARSGNARSMFEKRKPGTRDGAVERMEGGGGEEEGGGGGGGGERRCVTRVNSAFRCIMRAREESASRRCTRRAESCV